MAVRILPQRKHIVILTYHRVGNRQQLAPEPVELAECTLEEFEAEMTWVRRYCTPIDLAELHRIIHEGKPCPNRAVFVTFDDGYREDLFRVRPCLKRLGIRPVVFLPTDYIGTNRRFWWDRVGVCIHTTSLKFAVIPLLNKRPPIVNRSSKSLSSRDGEQIYLSLGSAEKRDASMAHLLMVAKKLPSMERDLFIAKVEQILELKDTRYSPCPLVINWDEARSLQDDFDFEAHTITHPVLSTLSADAAREELVKSKMVIEEQLDKPCTTMAIPYGSSEDYTPETIRIATEAGYSTIFSLEETLRGVIWQDGMALLDRIVLSPNDGPQGLAAKVTWPWVFVPDWTTRVKQQLDRFRG